MSETVHREDEPGVAPPTDGAVQVSAWVSTGVLLAIGLCLYVMTEALLILGPRTLTGEAGAIELTQLALLGGAMIVVGTTVGVAGCRSASIPFFCLLASMFIRELDGAFDRLSHGSWKYPAWTVALGGAAFGALHRASAARAARAILEGRAGGLLLSAAFLILVESRLIGRQDVWSAVLGVHYVRDVPRLIEELSELAGYGVLLIACIEARAVWRSLGRKRVRPVRPICGAFRGSTTR
ncbi:MAG: hypothetical protein AAF726_01705 [Planctomycetota bacterium]